MRPGTEQNSSSRAAKRSGLASAWPRLAFIGLAAFLFVTGAIAVIAGNSENVSSFWSTPQSTPAAAPAQDANVVRPRHKVTHKKALAAATPATPAAPAVTPTYFVAVLGDNLGLHLATGLQEALADKPEISILRKYKESSGLVRDDFYDWVKTAHELLAGKDKIDLAVMFIGSNDDQSLHDASGTYEIRSDRWHEIYAQRVDAVAQEFKAKDIPLIWVGMPIMRSDKLASDMAYINGIYREEAAKTGATYIDTWEGFVDEDGQYSDFGPNVSGERVRLRASDGVHFTKAGARKLAGFVENEVRRGFDKAAPPVDLAAVISGKSDGGNALPPEPTVDVNTLIQRELGHDQSAPPPSDQRKPEAPVEASLPVPDLPREPVIPVKPVAGPIFPLTTAPVSPGGELATRGKSPAANVGADALALLERALVEGKPLEAKPGRADDFSWPATH